LKIVLLPMFFYVCKRERFHVSQIIDLVEHTTIAVVVDRIHLKEATQFKQLRFCLLAE
jgi:hypothetical protein